MVCSDLLAAAEIPSNRTKVRFGIVVSTGERNTLFFEKMVDLSRFDAAPLIAFTATKETDYGTETDGPFAFGSKIVTQASIFLIFARAFSTFAVILTSFFVWLSSRIGCLGVPFLSFPYGQYA
jgi:hypothetical protein